MQDGHFISAKQKILYICTEENIKRIFWVTEDEVNFLSEIKEDWSEERIQQQQNEINGKFLNN